MRFVELCCICNRLNVSPMKLTLHNFKYEKRSQKQYMTYSVASIHRPMTSILTGSYIGFFKRSPLHWLKSFEFLSLYPKLSRVNMNINTWSFFYLKISFFVCFYSIFFFILSFFYESILLFIYAKEFENIFINKLKTYFIFI